MAKRGATKRLLAVDDNHDILRAMVKHFEDVLPNVVVHEAHNADEAIDLLRQHAFDAVLSDYRMPGRNGLDVLKEAHRLQPTAKRIMFTAFHTHELVQECHPFVDLMVTKPYDADIFAGKMKQMLSA
jgi:DNA-binding NarL/FixJ family response regulator